MSKSSTSTESRASRRYAVILAGGSGTRLWPLSRSAKPKQLLALDGDQSLLQKTALRLSPMVSASKVMTVTHEQHKFEVIGQLHSMDRALTDGVLSEPVARNTLPAIIWAVARISTQTPDAIVGVFSSDHAISDQGAFLKGWATAEDAADSGYLALLGMDPTEPSTAYGYIHAGERLSKICAERGDSIFEVRRFVEKPDRAAAERMLREGGHFWNGGMFVFRADRFLELVRQHVQGLDDAIAQLSQCEKTVSRKIYEQLPEVSIDYGLLEHTKRIAVVPVAMGWSDLGSWDALYQQGAKDDAGNMHHGPVVSVDSTDNLIWSDAGTVATFGVNDLAVVQTKDATLVCPRSRTNDLKPLVALVRDRHPALTEVHLTVNRPWGSYTVLEEGLRYKIKRIVVNPGEKLSMQMHYHRAEHWVVIAGTARIINGDVEMFLDENQSTYIPKTARHRLENPGKISLQIIEIQTGSYLEEDDIVRFGDVYGRV